MDNSVQHSYYALSESKGAQRIWMQGLRLGSAGFVKGVSYRVDYDLDNCAILLILDERGRRKVSGRKQANGSVDPIIDLARGDLSDVIGRGERVRADFYKGKIVITLHHLARKQEVREQRLKDHLSEGFITKGVLCSGIGVSAAAGHEGFKNQGIESRLEWIVDRERRYLQVAQDNNFAVTESTKIFEASLEELEPELLGYVDELSVSLPCTGHSTSGKAKNKIQYAEQHSTDALAVLGLIRVIDACQPAIVRSENVVEARNSATYELIKGMLDACGYHVHEVILDSDQSGSIENRRRWWFLAISKGLPQVDMAKIPHYAPEHDCLGDLLEDIPSNHKLWKSTAEKERKAALNKANGKNFGFQLVDASVKSIGVAGKSYQKDRASEPHLSGGEGIMRLLTPRELASAQRVPHSLITGITDAVAYEGLGQGISYMQCFGLSELLAKCVFSAFSNPKTDQIKSTFNLQSMKREHKDFLCESGVIQLAMF